MKSKFLATFLALFNFGVLATAALPPVVINEIMYHPPKGWESAQWVELHNNGTEAVSLEGWKLSGTVQHSFSAGKSIPAGGYLVLAHDAAAFKKAYSTAASGEFTSELDRDEGLILLSNAAGEPVDRVRYKDRERWPKSADGGSSSLERVYSKGGSEAGNWAASKPTEERRRPGGTPGRQNEAFSSQPVPEIRRARASSPVVKAGEKFQISARVSAEGGVEKVVAKIRLLGTAVPSEIEVPLLLDKEGNAIAELTAKKSPGIYRIRLEATGKNGATRMNPDPAEVHPEIPVLIAPNEAPGKIDLAYIFLGTAPSEQPNRNDEPSAENQLVWRQQQRFQTEANLQTLVASLAVTNELAPGQLAKLRPILKTAFDRRNQLVTEMYEADDVATAANAIPRKLTEWRQTLVKELRPHLTPEQIPQLDAWGSQSSRARQRGMDPNLMLTMWLNLEQFAFNAIALTSLNENDWKAIRTALQTGLNDRARLRDSVATAFASNESRQKFEEEVAKIRETTMNRLEKVPGGAELQNPPGGRDLAMFFRQITPKEKKNDSEPILGAFVHISTRTGKATLYDHVDIKTRSAGWKVHLADGDQYLGMSAFNVIFESNDRFVLAEPLAFDLYRRAGNAAPATEFVRLSVNGEGRGYHLLVEQPNRRFLSRQGLNPAGDFYKITWRGQTLEQTHEIKTPGGTHEPLKELVRRLEAKNPDEQWANIRKDLNLPQVMTYFAVNSVLGHWDGYMNNYFIFKDTRGSGKWTIYPWDQDKTFGFHDGVRGDEVFTDMPINFGAWGDKPPGWTRATPPKSFFETFQMRGAAWWRQPGPISGPLIAHPEARKLYASRIRSLLENEFSAERMNSSIDALGALLREEVGLRGKQYGDESDSLRRHEANIHSLKSFVAGRRRYLLAQDEIKNAAPWNPAAIP